jgi:hypothetical protein
MRRSRRLGRVARHGELPALRAPAADAAARGTAKLAAGRSEDDDRRPRGKDGKPKAGRYKREFGVPQDKAQENFTDPDSRLMERAGDGWDAGYNARKRPWTMRRTSSWRPN